MQINKIYSNTIYPTISNKTALRHGSKDDIQCPAKKSLSDCSYIVNPIILKRYISNHRISFLKPIKSQDEYNKILKEMYNYSYYACGRDRLFFDDTGYQHADNNLKALSLYCGLNDRSYMINSWLSGRRKNNYRTLSDNKIANAIRAFEYSLRELDKKYGKFEGKVFRNGYFNPNTDRQYYSASDNFSCAKAFSHHADAIKFKPYSIIKVKNAHKIYKFQEDVNSPVSIKFSEREHEVLIDRKSKFRRIPPEEYTKEDIKDIKMILKKAYHVLPWQMDLDKLEQKYKLVSSIAIWEEI